MHERSTKSHIISTTIFTTLMCAAFIFGVLLMWRATAMGQISTGIIDRFKIGPISMFELSKVPVASGGFKASITFLPGLVLYAFMALAAGLVITWYRLRSYKFTY